MPRKTRILIVDDELPVCRSMAKALTAQGYEIDIAQSGAEALEKDRDNRYDVIVSDLMMPGISGMDLLKAFKDDRPEVMVIMVTGYPSIKTAVQSIKLGAFDYLPKPFTADELRAMVSRALSRKRFHAEEIVGTASEYPDVPIPDGTYALPENSWVRQNEEGYVLIGIHPMLMRTLRMIKDIEFPEVGEMRYQGESCLRITDDENTIHRLWAPVTGRVIAVNTDVAEDYAGLLNDPFENAWVILVSPAHFEEDVKNLELLSIER